jgi:hypothetical protein
MARHGQAPDKAVLRGDAEQRVWHYENKLIEVIATKAGSQTALSNRPATQSLPTATYGGDRETSGGRLWSDSDGNNYCSGARIYRRLQARRNSAEPSGATINYRDILGLRQPCCKYTDIQAAEKNSVIGL